MKESGTRNEARIGRVTRVRDDFKYHWITLAAVRELLHEAGQESTEAQSDVAHPHSGAVVRVGSRVTVDLDRFEAWLEERRLANSR